MALFPCRECGEQISNQAKICPKCGVKKPIESKNHLLNAIKNNPKKSIGIILLLVVMSAAGNHDQSANTSDQSTSSSASVSPLKQKIYNAVIRCGDGGIPTFQCFENTGIKVNAWGRGDYLTQNDIMNLYVRTQNTDLHINLGEHYELIAQNSNQYYKLTVTITDIDGNTVFQDQAGQYGVVRVEQLTMENEMVEEATRKKITLDDLTTEERIEILDDLSKKILDRLDERFKELYKRLGDIEDKLEEILKDKSDS